MALTSLPFVVAVLASCSALLASGFAEAQDTHELLLEPRYAYTKVLRSEETISRALLGRSSAEGQLNDGTMSETKPRVERKLASLPAEYDYSTLLSQSYFFYEAQRSGILPSTRRVWWRGNSALSDAAPGGQSLAGGHYDAGGTVSRLTLLFEA
ncbi:hypothetical protein WJX74_007668 [Apatococcus lobatus]|uniref:cellulase n=1 Tax=Apatococcus lobatus TaxID=904363 RepID=A0AAW1QH48_9CHLO